MVSIASSFALGIVCARLATAQLPPPPPQGIAVHLPEKADPSITIPHFEVISVKPSKDNLTRVQFTADGMHGTSVMPQFLLFEGFGGINQNQVIGMPPWAATDGFDIDAKVAAEDIPTLARMTFEQRRSMFRQILADRFKLVMHHERRPLPIYALVVAKGGSKLTASPPDDPAAAAPRRKGMMFGEGKVVAMGGSMSMFVTPMSRLLGRVVVDKTGLSGTYDFTLEWTPESASATGTASGAEVPGQSGPDIFTAIQEQLGLKLEPGKAPVDVVVIDHIEKPAAN